MQQIGIPLMRDTLKLADTLRKCSKNLLYNEGKQVHGAVLRMGYESDIMINIDLIDMYGKCGRMEEAHLVFDKMPERSVVAWTALMCGYMQAGNAMASLLLLNEMGNSNVRPNEYTLSTNIKACAVLGDLDIGKQIHSICSKSGLEWHPVIGNSIIDMYSKCGRIIEAERMFYAMPVKSLITWNVMIAGYAQCKDTCDKSLNFLEKMQKQGQIPDGFTFSSTLKACSSLGAIHEGRQIHAFLIRKGYNISTHKILSGALVDLYAQCGFLHEAQKVFTQMETSVVSWTALIVGYAKNGHLSEALNLFTRLRGSNVISIDSFVLSSVISVFADFAMVDLGQQMHALTIKSKSKCDLDVSVGNSILDMYLKCGLTYEAEKYFSQMAIKNVVSYTILIAGYGKHGLGKRAVRVFEKMEREKIEPDCVTYLAVLSACSHCGLVEDSQKCFTRLCNDYSVKPSIEHYACLVDVLGREGRLKEAKNVIETMPLRANMGIWQTLFNACRLHKNVEMGIEVGEILLGFDDGESVVNYVLVSNMYADIGCWRECERLRGLVKDKGFKKEAGCSW